MLKEIFDEEQILLDISKKYEVNIKDIEKEFPWLRNEIWRLNFFYNIYILNDFKFEEKEKIKIQKREKTLIKCLNDKEYLLKYLEERFKSKKRYKSFLKKQQANILWQTKCKDYKEQRNFYKNYLKHLNYFILFLEKSNLNLKHFENKILDIKQRIEESNLNDKELLNKCEDFIRENKEEMKSNNFQMKELEEKKIEIQNWLNDNNAKYAHRKKK